ncbi:MAG: hypothetical protein ACK5RX_06655, partial [bacterium]
ADIPFAKSLSAYIFRWMGKQFIPGYSEANAPTRDHQRGEADAQPMARRIAAAVGTQKADRQRTEHPLPFADDGHDDGGGGSGSGAEGGSTSMTLGVSRQHTHKHMVVERTVTTIDQETDLVRSTGTLSASENMLAKAMEQSGDGPPCESCGTITVRNGTCHKCLNCGASLGCS